MISLDRLREAGILKNLPEIRAAIIGQWERLAGGRWAAETDTTEILEPLHERIRTLELPLGPVTSVTSVKERSFDDATDWADLAALAATSYRLDGEGRRLMKRGGFWRDEVELVYSGGYADDTAPGDILEALVLQARFMAERHAAGKIALAQQAAKDATTTYLRADYHPLFMETAKRHRRLT